MIELVAALSDHVSDGLAAAGYPRLKTLLNGQPGRILVGDRHQYDQQLPPRIIWRPTKSTWGPRSHSRGTANVATNQNGYDAESAAAVGLRVFGTEMASFEVACWSLAPEGQPDQGMADYEFTRALYLQFIASANALMIGCYTLEGGIWRPAVHVPRVGREFVFSITISLPLITELQPTTLAPAGSVWGNPFAPSDVEPDVTDEMVLPTGVTGAGCE